MFDFEKWRPRFAEKQVKNIFLEVTPQKRSAKVARQLCGQVWENLGKNPLHPQKFAFSYTIGVREGILLRGRKKFALKITICPESNFFSLIRMGLKPLVNLFYTVEFVYNGFVCNVNSPITLHFVRSRWHLSHAFQFACNVISAITFFMQSPRGALTGKLCSYLAC